MVKTKCSRTETNKLFDWNMAVYPDKKSSLYCVRAVGEEKLLGNHDAFCSITNLLTGEQHKKTKHKNWPCRRQVPLVEILAIKSFYPSQSS